MKLVAVLALCVLDWWIGVAGGATDPRPCILGYVLASPMRYGHVRMLRPASAFCRVRHEILRRSSPDLEHVVEGVGRRGGVVLIPGNRERRPVGHEIGPREPRLAWIGLDLHRGVPGEAAVV
jgi:hypothetical protein